LGTSFTKVTIQDETSMSNFLLIIKDLLVQIAGVGDVIKDEEVVLTILNVLLETYESFVQGMSVQETFSNYD
jgi:hypothetical protein